MFRTVNKVKCLNERRCYVLADVISIFVYEVPCIFWHYINVDEVSLITLKKVLQSAMELLQIATAYFITKCDGQLLQIASAFLYKVRHGLLQIATGVTKCDGFITKCDRYYKVRWLIQMRQYNVPQKMPRLTKVSHVNKTWFKYLLKIFWQEPL